MRQLHDIWDQLAELDRALGALRIRGLGRGIPAYDELWKARGKLFGQMGFRVPREVRLLQRLVGLSPGTINLWHDVECGWMTEARESPGSPAVYRSVTDDVAAALIKGELTHELELQLMTPDYYYGE